MKRERKLCQFKVIVWWPDGARSELETIRNLTPEEFEKVSPALTSLTRGFDNPPSPEASDPPAQEGTT